LANGERGEIIQEDSLKEGAYFLRSIKTPTVGEEALLKAGKVRFGKEGKGKEQESAEVLLFKKNEEGKGEWLNKSFEDMIDLLARQIQLVFSSEQNTDVFLAHAW